MWLTLFKTVMSPSTGKYVPGRWPAVESDLTWTEVVATLRELCTREAEYKTALPAWGPYRLKRQRSSYSNNPSTKALPRANENVDHVSLHVLDVDRCDADALWRTVVAEVPRALMYSSPSDDPTKRDARRVRLVIPAPTPVPARFVADARLDLAEALGLLPGSGVEGAIDAARVLFAGRIAGTSARQVWEK